jgi:hypothetical protein
MFKDSIITFQGLIEFIKGLIANKLIFEVNLDFNWKKLKSTSWIAILKSQFGQIKIVIALILNFDEQL